MCWTLLCWPPPPHVRLALAEELIGTEGLILRMLLSREKTMQFAVQRVIFAATEPMLEKLLTAIPTKHALNPTVRKRLSAVADYPRPRPPHHIELVVRDARTVQLVGLL